MINKMGSIEIIEIRLSQKLNEVFEEEIRNVIGEVINRESRYSMKLFHKMQLPSDYLIIIFHSQKLTENKKSELGQQLKVSLRDFGLINHSAWNELA